jgi:hypothetical protein
MRAATGCHQTAHPELQLYEPRGLRAAVKRSRESLAEALVVVSMEVRQKEVPCVRCERLAVEDVYSAWEARDSVATRDTRHSRGWGLVRQPTSDQVVADGWEGVGGVDLRECRIQCCK